MKTIRRIVLWLLVIAVSLQFCYVYRLDKKITEFTGSFAESVMDIITSMLPAQPNFNNLKQATIEVKVGRVGGAGILFKEDENYLYALTAKHIIEFSAGKITVKVTSCSNEKYYVIIDRKLVRKDDAVDLALIKIPKPNDKFTVLNIAKIIPSMGNKIYTIGHPVGTRYTINEGILSNYSAKSYEGKKGDYMLISAPSFSGSSGGAVVNIETEIIGIVVGVFYLGNNPRNMKDTTYLFYMTYAVRLEDIERIIADEKKNSYRL